MRKLALLAAIATITLTSCCKERDYLCTVESGGYENYSQYNKAVIPFHGTYPDMRTFEANNTWGTPYVSPTWKVTTCR